MIASVRGTVAAVGAADAVIEAGGIGYRVFATATTLSQLRVGADMRLSTSLVVREDSMTLYGFADEDEAETFKVLTTISGVGPKLALAILSVHTPDNLRSALARESLADLTRVSGIGKKSAQRIILEVGDRLGPVRGGVDAPPPASSDSADVVEALVGLGWTEADAERVVAAVAEESGDLPVHVMLREALKKLGRH